jgi:hypothetical protein
MKPMRVAAVLVPVLMLFFLGIETTGRPDW